MDLINCKLFVELIVEDNRESVLRATLARADDGIRLDKKHVHRYKVFYKRFVCYSRFERACVIVFCGAQSNEHCCFFSINSRKTRFSLLMIE